MSGVDATAYVMRLAMKTPAHKLALLAVAARCDQHYSCFPSRALVAGEALISEERAKTILRELRRDGFLSARQRYRENGSKTSNRYFVHGPWDRWNETNQPFPEIKHYADQDDRYAAIREGEFIPRPAPKPEEEGQQGGGVADNPSPDGEGGGVADAPSPGVADNPSQGGTGNPSVTRHYQPVTANHADALPDAVGQSSGGFARAGAHESAADEIEGGDGGFAASGKNSIPRQQQGTAPGLEAPGQNSDPDQEARPASGQPERKRSPRPATVKTTPRKMPVGFNEVRAAVPVEVARPGTQLWVGLRSAIADLLTGNPNAGIPARTPSQVIARMNRRWYGQRGPDRSAPGYTPATDAPGDRPIDSPSAWLAKAIIERDCPDPACEDGLLIGSGETCDDCAERRAEMAAARAGRDAADKLIRDAMTRYAKDTADYEEVAAWLEAGARERHAGYGLTGGQLDQAVAADLARWREKCPPPAISRPPAPTPAPTPRLAYSGRGRGDCCGWNGVPCGHRAVTRAGLCVTCHGIADRQATEAGATL